MKKIIPSHNTYLKILFHVLLSCFFLVSCSDNLNNSTTSFTRFRCLPHQSSTLLQLKREFFTLENPRTDIGNDVSYAKMDSWKAESDCCFWDGVTCDMSTGHLVSLDLSSSWLQGPLLSNSSLFSLVQLQKLNLAFNNFRSGKIPPEFGQLSRLTHLNLSNSVFSGTVPFEISSLSKMISLDFSTENTESFLKIEDLRGFLQNMANLKKLSLDMVDLSSTHQLEFLANLSSLTSLSLMGCNFSGTIPSPIGNLSQLTYLDLSDNSFIGKLPLTLGKLQRLVVLDLSWNQFSGEIPSSLGNITELKVLSLLSNNLVGPFPSSIGQLSQLVNLVVSNNSLDGFIPSSLFNLPSLKYLYLDYNKFTGHLFIHNISSSSSSQLKKLNLASNNLNGQIPKSISKFERLTSLDLSFNNFNGTIELGNFSDLEELNLSNNSLLSVANSSSDYYTFSNLELVFLSSCNLIEFPNFLKAQNRIEQLDLSKNKIKGKIPKWFCRTGIETLYLLDLSQNSITGWEEPPLILPWKKLQYLDLGSNQLQGSIAVPSLSTVYFMISNNYLTGEIHPFFCKLSDLQVLDVSNNHLSGSIPECLVNSSTSLAVLNMQNNDFHGKIPPNFREGSNLKTLDLSHNKLQGTVPRSLVKCRKLELLNLGDNQISDTFPFQLQNLPELQVVVLRWNKFFGPIWDPYQHFGFEKLRIIDISFNNFNGTLPSDYFRNWSSMIKASEEDKSHLRYMEDKSTFYHDSIRMSVKGVASDYTRIPTTLTIIDLSNNRFFGEIPHTMGNLRSLHALNLSSNNFTGLIPPWFGNLAEMESLDLSKNNFSGKIPQQFTGLTYLSYLNVSHNHLTGQIPQSTQMSTFPSSCFEGNLGLCGIPLLNKCEKLRSSTARDDAHNSEEKYGFGWKQVLLGYGFGLVVGVFIERVANVKKIPIAFGLNYRG